MYKYTIDEDIKKDVNELMQKWEELLEFSDKKDFEVNDFKKNFAEVTKGEVEAFKVKIKDEYDQYMAKGPGTSQVTLDEGVELLNASKEKIK
jgi:dynein heavy chain